MTDEYARGFADGVASRDDEVFSLTQQADLWYFRANNPRSAWPDVMMVNAIIDGREAREALEQRFAELDRIEQKKFSDARALIAEGFTDIEIATRVGLFLPIVANLREGVL